MSQSECVCATNVTVGELRVHRCLSSAIVLMCLCHLCLPFCHLCVICVLCDVFCFCSTESRGGFFSKQKALCQCS